MEFKTKHIGSFGGSPAEIIELTIESSNYNAQIIENLTDFDGFVDDNFIDRLRWLADELEEHNNKVKSL